MPLLKLEDFYPDYRQDTMSDDDIKHYDVYARSDDGQEVDKVGSVYDILVDGRDGSFRYFVVDTGFWIFGKKVLLPVGRADINTHEKRVYAQGLTKQQVEDLPNFDNLDEIDYEREEQIRNVYRPTVASTASTTVHNRDTYDYDRDPALYNLSEQNHQSLKLYEERLVANKQRQKTGEAVIGKHVETETTHVSVPVEKERVVIERTQPTSNSAVDPSQATFREGEVARMEVYEETPDIHKEAFVSEEVSIRKEVERETVDAEETIRREELDIDTEGQSRVNKQR
jgi:uncharacterized protein (TIGR02271 family)